MQGRKAMMKLIFGPALDESFFKSLAYVLLNLFLLFVFGAFAFSFTVGLPATALSRASKS